MLIKIKNVAFYLEFNSYKQLFLGGTKDAEDPELREYFSKFGHIEDLKVVKEFDTNR